MPCVSLDIRERGRAPRTVALDIDIDDHALAVRTLGHMLLARDNVNHERAARMVGTLVRLLQKQGTPGYLAYSSGPYILSYHRHCGSEDV